MCHNRERRRCRQGIVFQRSHFTGLCDYTVCRIKGIPAGLRNINFHPGMGIAVVHGRPLSRFDIITPNHIPLHQSCRNSKRAKHHDRRCGIMGTIPGFCIKKKGLQFGTPPAFPRMKRVVKLLLENGMNFLCRLSDRTLYIRVQVHRIHQIVFQPRIHRQIKLLDFLFFFPGV